MTDKASKQALASARLTRFIKHTPALVGLLLTFAGTLEWVGLERWASYLGAGSPHATSDGITVVLLLVQTGYFATAVPLLRRAGQQSLKELQPLIDSNDPEVRKLTNQFYGKLFPGLQWTIIVGAILAITLQEAQFARFSLWLAQPDAALGELWTVLAAWLTWSLGLSSVIMAVKDSAAMKRLGRDFIAVDLLRIDQLATFPRYGLKLAGTVIALMALWAVIIVLITAVVGNPWPERSSYIGLLLALFYTGLSISMFVFPQTGIRERIEKEKSSVLEQLTSLLPTSDQTFIRASTNPQRLAAILQSRTEIQAISDWPAGDHTRLRLAFYLFVPPLSWSAAALVEEVVSRLLN